jgi:hypothetical protein
MRAKFVTIKGMRPMPFDSLEAATFEDARMLAIGQGRCLVLALETLRQIEEAEAAGAFEGGMTGNADGAPFSIEGQSGEPSNAASDPPEPFDMDGALVISIEGLAEKALDFRDIIEAFKGVPLGPVILVPTKELKKWASGGAGDDGA